MADTAHYPGDVVRVTAEFRDATTSALADPTAVDVITRSPTKAITTQPATKDSTGIYHADITVDRAGPWSVQIRGTGAIARSTIVRFDVTEGVDT